jgi:hypothetical protein
MLRFTAQKVSGVAGEEVERLMGVQGLRCLYAYALLAVTAVLVVLLSA